MPSGGAAPEDRPASPEPTAGARRAAGGGPAGRGAGGPLHRTGVGRPGESCGSRTGAARARAGRPGPDGEAVPVAVTWDERQRRPVAFVWRRRRYRVERVLEMWVLETGWWRDEGHISRSYWRVRAGGRVVDLRYDRLGKAWALEREVA